MKLRLSILGLSLIIISILFISCLKKNTPGDTTNNEGEYELNVNSFAGSGSDKTLIGKNINTTWDSYNQDVGYALIYLGADEIYEPLGTLTLKIEKPTTYNGNMQAKVLFAQLSTTDKRVGTGEELNGRLYELKSGNDYYISISEMDDVHLRVDAFIFDMYRIAVNQNDEAEDIELSGHFIAK